MSTNYKRNWTTSKLKSLALQNTTLRKLKDKLGMGENIYEIDF